MNVLFCADGKHAHGGGVTSYVQCLFRHLDRRRFTPYDWNLWSGYEFVRIVPRNILSRVYRRGKVLQVFLTFSRLLARGRIHLVHLNPSLGSGAVRRDLGFARKSAAAGLPFVVFFHGWNQDYAARLESRPRKLRQFVQTFGRAGKIVVLASAFKERFVQWGMDEARIVVETTAVDDRPAAEYDIARRLRRQTAGHLRILFLSRIERAKGIYEALDTLRLLRQKYPHVTMTIAGEGTESVKARQYAREQGIEGTRFLGWVDGAAKREAFAAADLYLFPTSWGEGMPVAVLEAMACGLPVITCPMGGIPDFFQDGKMGFLVDRPRSEILADRCERLIRDPEARRRIGRFNHEYAMQRFLASQVARRMETLYTEVLEAHPCRTRS